MCHNCGAGTSFFNFLNQVDPNLSAEYTMERYKNSDKTNQPDPDFTEVKTKPVFEHKIDLPSIDSLPDDHYAKIYVKSRKIPEKQLSKLFFADDFKKFVSSFGVDKDLHDRDQRLIIPFFDRENKLLGFQGRALGQSKLRYITIRLNEGLGLPLFFGADSVDESEKILVLEGPIDSMFL
jgi:DNA primase